MMGLFALAGGDEFRPAYEFADRALLAAMPPQSSIVIVPTAAAQQGPEQAIANGIAYFRRLDPRATVEGTLIVDTASANDQNLVARIASAGMVYLTGGDPGYLVHTLRGSEALAAIAAVAARGGVVAGSSAGAIAMGETMRWGSGWEPGLGFINNLVVLPHHADRPNALALVRASWPASSVVLGIPTGVVCLSRSQNTQSGEPDTWEVLGKRPVTLYRADGITQIQPGAMFTL
jgi:cyanophycinase